MGCSTYLGLGWRYQPLAPGHPTSICDIGVKCNLTRLTTKKSWHSLGGQRLLVGSACAEHCFVVAFKRGGS